MEGSGGSGMTRAYARALYGAYRTYRRRDRELAACEYQDMLLEADAKTRFDRIYTRRLWSRITRSKRTASGNGSTTRVTATFRRELVRFLNANGPGVLFDAPCGDLHYMRRVKLPAGWTYVGGDIAPSLVHDLQRKFPERDFIEFDITHDRFPACDVWLCRHCLFHLSFDDIWRTLANFAHSSCDLALITNQMNVARNTDIVTGDYRPLDLTLAPFNLPTPIIMLDDFSDPKHPTVACVWRRQTIASTIRSGSTATLLGAGRSAAVAVP
jgi:hypothetical protein